MRIESNIRQHSNDLFADIGRCDCDKMQYSSGYADDNFFRNVNAQPRLFKCSACGWERMVQWTYGGVKIWTVAELAKEGNDAKA